MKKLIVITTLMLLFSACSAQGEKDPSSQSVDETEKATQETETSSEPEPEPEPETVEITADVSSLKDNAMVISYEGKELELDLSECKYNSSIYGWECPDITERIINNPFGIKTKATLKCDPDLTKAYFCDVLTPNGSGMGLDTIECAPKEEKIIEQYCEIGKGSCSVYDFTTYQITENGVYQTEGKIDLSGCDIFSAAAFKEKDKLSAVAFKFADKDCYIAGGSYSTESDRKEKNDSKGNLVFVEYEYSAAYVEDPAYYGQVTGFDKDSGKTEIKLNNGETRTAVPSLTLGCHSFSEGDKVRVRFSGENGDFCVVEKTDGVSFDEINILGNKVYDLSGSSDMDQTIATDKFIDDSTSEETEETSGYTKAFAEHEDVDYVEYEGQDICYHVSAVRLGR